jgi:hydrogenase maturation protease
MSSTRPRILVAGIGNIFLGDDAFGVEVVQRLLNRQVPPGVRIVDFGIRGLDLAYALLESYDAVILVDAMPRGGQPGTLYVLEPEAADSVASEQPALLDTHSMDPARVLALASALGGKMPRLIMVGCEPAAPVDADPFAANLSKPVRAAVDEAVPLIESLVERLLGRDAVDSTAARAMCAIKTACAKEDV